MCVWDCSCLFCNLLFVGVKDIIADGAEWRVIVFSWDKWQTAQAFVEQLQTSYACFALLRVLCFSLIAPFSQCFFFAIFSFDYNRALLELLLAVMS